MKTLNWSAETLVCKCNSTGLSIHFGKTRAASETWLILYLVAVNERTLWHEIAFFMLILKPLIDERVFYDKFLCDKFYLLVCTRNFDNFFYDKCTCSKASMLAFEHASALVIEKLVKVQILLVCMGQQRKLVKVIWAFDAIGQRIVKVNLSK